MKQPGLDGRHRDKDGITHRKHGDTLNENLSSPIPGFGPRKTLAQMRKVTGEESEAAVRKAAKKLFPNT